MNIVMYLNLLKQCLLDNIYANQNHVNQLGNVVHKATEYQIQNGTYWPERAHTMIGALRMNNIQHCVETCLADGVEGDLIETGVWRGGATIFMKGILEAHGVKDRKVFVADSFEGLPKPNEQLYPADKGDQHHTVPFLAVSLDQVIDNFKKYNLLDNSVVFIKGFFEDSIKDAPIDKLAVLRLDGDMYSSTIVVLEHLYPKVSKGGFIIVDDYCLKGCNQAVHDYRAKHGITDEITIIDACGAFWRKSM